MKKKFKRKLAVTFLVFFVITAVLGIVTFIRSYNNTVRDADKSYEEISSVVYDSVIELLSEPIEDSKAMAGDKILIELLESENDISDAEMVKKVTDYLSSASKEMNVEYAYCTSDSTKRYFSCDGLEKIINPKSDTHDEWYSKFIESGKEYNVSIDTDQINNGVWTVFVDSRIVDSDGKLLGSCAVGNPIAGLQQILNDYESNYDIKINFVDKNGVVKIDIDSVNIEREDTAGIQYSNMSTSEEAYCYTAADGSKVVMRYVDDLGLYLVVRAKN